MSYVLDISMLTDELVELVELLPKLKMLSFETRQAIRDYLNTFFAHGIQKWLRKSEQGDKWNRCLIEGMIVLSETGARDEQTTPP